jgi:hypothetical protein
VRSANCAGLIINLKHILIKGIGKGVVSAFNLSITCPEKELK